MKIAVISHTRRDSPDADFGALADAVTSACAQGATVVVLPQLAWLAGSTGAEGVDGALAVTRRLQDACPGAEILGSRARTSENVPAIEGRSPAVALIPTRLGGTVALEGDDCLDSLAARDLASATPDAVILRSGSESDLQAEAMIERALAFSESVAGLVIVAESDGAPAGEPGHGGSVIVVSGEIVAESIGGDEVLIADVPVTPVPPPEPRDALPELPPILAQRLALHRGERASVSYPADLS
jgi:predicted amidohydrolase